MNSPFSDFLERTYNDTGNLQQHLEELEYLTKLFPADEANSMENDFSDDIINSKEERLTGITKEEDAKNSKPCEGRTCWAKTVLNNLYGGSLLLNNILDESTKVAVANFQAKNNLPQTQKIDAVTERALLEIAAIQKHKGTPNENAAVTIIQSAKTKIEDWTERGTAGVKAKPQHILNSYRDPRKIYAFVLHQMAFKRQGRESKQYSDPTSYVNTGAHFCIMLDGRIILLHPMSRMIWHGNCVSPRSVAVEFEGNFPNVKGKWWVAKSSQSKDHPTQAQFDSGRFLASYLKTVLGTTHILAHRQSSDTRENDPGPDIWYHVGQWAIENLDMTDGGPTFKCGKGNPILPEWRSWGAKKVQSEFEGYAEAEEWQENLLDEETRSSQSSLGLVSASMTIVAEKQGQIKGGVIKKGREGTIEIIAFSHGIVLSRDAASGMATGKRMHKPLVITKEIDDSSVKLLQALTTNERLKQVVINFYQPMRSGKDAGIETNYYRIELINAAVANISHDMPNVLDAAATKLPVMERIELVYQKIQWSYLGGSRSVAEDDWLKTNEVTEEAFEDFEEYEFNEEEELAMQGEWE